MERYCIHETRKDCYTLLKKEIKKSLPEIKNLVTKIKSHYMGWISSQGTLQDSEQTKRDWKEEKRKISSKNTKNQVKKMKKTLINIKEN